MSRLTDAELDLFWSQCYHLYNYLNQGAVWLPKQPAEPVRIGDMDPEWRYNASRFLERRAQSLAFRYQWGMVSAASQPIGREVIGEKNGESVYAGRRALSHLDIMGEDAQDAFDEAVESVSRDPLAFLRGTELYRALVADLPTGADELAQLAERAKHWSTCPTRTGGTDCQCDKTGGGRSRS